MKQINTKNVLIKKARRKFLSNGIKNKLSMITDSRLIDSYKKSFICSHTLLQTGTKLTSIYCNQRWCPTCTAIKTAKFIDAYKHEIEAYNDFFFVTLTIKSDTINKSNLEHSIKQMILSWKRINAHARKLKERGKLDIWHGMRKIECTYRENGTFHPHFHILVRTEYSAKLIIDKWLELNTTSTIEAQNCTLSNSGVEKELFKYYTKLVTGSSKKASKSINAIALNDVLEAMIGKRVFHNFGTFKKQIKEEEIPELESQSFDIQEDIASFKWRKNDWLNEETGELLTGYMPSQGMEKLIYSEGNKSSVRKQFLSDS